VRGCRVKAVMRTAKSKRDAAARNADYPVFHAHRRKSDDDGIVAAPAALSSQKICPAFPRTTAHGGDGFELAATAVRVSRI